LFTLATAWDITTAVFSSAVPLFYVNSNDVTKYTINGLSGIYINESESRLYVSDYNNDFVFEFDISPATILTGRSFNANTSQFNVWNNLQVNGFSYLTQGFYSIAGATIAGALSCNTITSTSSSTTHSIATGITTGTVNVATAVTTGASNFGTGQTSGAITLGGTAATGAINIGRATTSQTLNFGTGVTSTGNTKTINLGTAGAVGSTTIFNFGSATGTVSYALLGTSITFNGVALPRVDQTNTFTAVQSFQAGIREYKNTLAANNIDLNLGNYFTKTISGATTLTVSNIPSTGNAFCFVLDLTNGASATITWFAGIKWPGGTAPTLTASGRDVLTFFTHDGGTTWTGILSGKDVK